VKETRILVADDHRDFRRVVTDFLNGLPNVIVVGEACDGVEVIDKLEQLDADVVLMDITMPRRNGLDATRIIKQRWPWKKVVIATMHDSAFYRAQARCANADGFVLKSSLKNVLQAMFAEGGISAVGITAQ
jgi:DNA-binding NarL/FixJ family response regulator